VPLFEFFFFRLFLIYFFFQENKKRKKKESEDEKPQGLRNEEELSEYSELSRMRQSGMNNGPNRSRKRDDLRSISFFFFLNKEV
jgi:regulatory protein YycI of two-component signal transduction system YycFG